MTANTHFPWLKKISAHLQEYDQVPLFGQSPSFDWDAFSTQAATRLQLPNLSFHLGASQWREATTLSEGLGSDLVALPLSITPVSGSAFWIMSKDTIAKLTSWMINGQIKSRPVSSEPLTSGFYRYMALQLLDIASSMPPFQQTSILLSQPAELPQTDAFCIDVEIKFDTQTCWGRLAIEPQLQKNWAEFFAHPATETQIPPHAQSIELTLGVKVGSSTLDQTEWDSLKPGDFLLLDQGGYDPRKHQGAAYLTLGSTPLFQIKIKQNKIQLLDYAFTYHEDTMAEQTSDPFNNTEATQLPEAAPQEPINLKALPINLTVELSRVRITLEKLTQLAPGNLLELPITPDQPVTLTVNGRPVGQAELVHLGETLGVRILTLA